MKKFSLFKYIALALGCAMLAITTATAQAGDIKGHAGTTFTLTPVEFDANGNPTKFTHTVDGVVRVFQLGNCTVHFDVIVVPNPDGSFGLAGTVRITTANGATTLNADVNGIGTADPANPALFLNFHYDVTLTSGTGAMTNARGKAAIDGFAMFTPGGPVTGKATWLLDGNVETRRRNRQ